MELQGDEKGMLGGSGSRRGEGKPGGKRSGLSPSFGSGGFGETVAFRRRWS